MGLLGEADQDLFPAPSLISLWEAPGAYPDWPLPLAEMEHWPDMPTESPSSQGSMESLVNPRWHYIEHEALGIELYNWRRDPEESRDMADSEEGHAIIDKFRDVDSEEGHATIDRFRDPVAITRQQ
jgi:hypothetical protein